MEILIKDKKGQSLIEALIALAASVMVVSAIAVAVINALNNANFSKNQSMATNYAQELIDSMRLEAKNNWQSFSTLSGNYCVNKENSITAKGSASRCDPNIDSLFIRELNILQNNAFCGGSGSTKVVSTVFWNDGKCASANQYCHDVALESCISNINLVPSP